MSLLSSIPSPSFNSFDIGPLSLNIYGLAIACGVIAAVWLFGKRLEERNAGAALCQRIRRGARGCTAANHRNLAKRSRITR